MQRTFLTPFKADPEYKLSPIDLMYVHSSLLAQYGVYVKINTYYIITYYQT